MAGPPAEPPFQKAWTGQHVLASPVHHREDRMLTVSMTVNGQKVTKEVDPRTLLVQFLREHLNLTGTHVGCDTSQCGACVVHVDGKSMKACTMLAAQAEGAEVKTIEGLAANGELHPMQAAFKEHHGLQCGFCTPGMIMSAVDLLQHNADPSETEIREWLEGNICRCTGYHNIVKAIRHAAQEMRS
jgi:carbon-monoxide dehydrogenase small subunit